MLRGLVFGIIADMGTERGICDISDMNPVIGRGKSRLLAAPGMRYPNALCMPEHLHMVFNSLQNGVETLPAHNDYLKRLRSIERFPADESLRRIYMATYMAHHPEQHRFKVYSSVAVDWQWETLCKALSQLLPLYELLQECYDLSFMTTSEEGKSDAVLLREVEEVLKTP